MVLGEFFVNYVKRTLQTIPTMMSILATQFESIIKLHKGEIIEDYRQEKKGYISATLPTTATVGRGDIITGGVAIKLDDPHPSLHPFSLRLLCTNGMISQGILQAIVTSEKQIEEDLTTIISKFDTYRLKHISSLARQSQQITVTHAQISAAVRKVRYILMRNSSHRAQITFDDLDRMHDVRRRMRELIRREQMRTSSPQDQSVSLFDLINAITDLAHDMHSPATRWELMEMGGAMLEAVGDFSREDFYQAGNEKEQLLYES